MHWPVSLLGPARAVRILGTRLSLFWEQQQGSPYIEQVGRVFGLSSLMAGQRIPTPQEGEEDYVETWFGKTTPSWEYRAATRATWA